MLNELSKKFLSIKNEITKLESQLDEVKAEIYTGLIDKIAKKPEGSVTEKTDLFKITVTNKLTVKVDQDKAKELPYLFKAKYEFSKELYENGNEVDRKAIDSIIETKPAKPSFSITTLE